MTNVDKKIASSETINVSFSHGLFSTTAVTAVLLDLTPGGGGRQPVLALTDACFHTWCAMCWMVLIP